MGRAELTSPEVSVPNNDTSYHPPAKPLMGSSGEFVGKFKWRFSGEMFQILFDSNLQETLGDPIIPYITNNPGCSGRDSC